MSKKKPTLDADLIPIADWQEADDLLCRLGEAINTIAALHADADVRINQIKASLSVQVDNIKETIGQITRSLERFAAAHKEEFGASRSRRLNFGVLGWRKSSRIIVAKDTLNRIRNVFGRRAAELLHIKESIDKEALAKLTDEELRAVSAKRKIVDAFFVEPDLVRAADH